ncbi:MAG TPA: polysaccharide biosynthesis tyrosine autokinase, partial [Flavisolibacter sp.]
LFAVAGAGAWLYIRFTTPLYESTARILIKDEKKGAEGAKTVEELNPLSTKKIIENETEVIRSRPLLDEVVKKLSLYAPVYEENRFKDRPAYTTSPVLIQVKNTEALKEVEKVPFSFDKATMLVLIGKKTYALNQWVNAGFGEMKFVPNPNHAAKESDASFYFSLIAPGKLTASIQQRLGVETPAKQSSILNLTLKDEVPLRGEHILNELMAEYNKAGITDKNTLASNTIVFLDDRLKDVEQDLAAIERKDQQYKAQKGAVDLGEQGRLFLQNVSSNDQKLSDINMQLAVLTQVDAYVRSKTTDASIVPSTLGVADPVLSQLVSKLYGYELEYESLKKTTAENNPAMLSLVDRMEKIRPNILENIQSQRRGLEAGKNNIASTNNAYSSIIRSLPEKERELVDINREKSIKGGIYAYLLQKREDVALSYASAIPDGRIVDKAQSSASPVSPRKKVIYLSAILAALFLGVGAVTAKESLSRKILFRQEIEKFTERPIIGEIAAVPLKDQLVIGSDKKTFVAEQFRKLRATLPYIGINSIKKRILVTSSVAGEGKSFVAANLALTLALTGKKVVLVDCDLNNPSLKAKLNADNKVGVTEYLLGKARMEDIIKPAGQNASLFFIAAGQLPHDPSELIMNGRIEDLLNELDAAFDYIIVDTAPVVPVTDAYTISPLCDATLFIIRHHYTPKVFVQRIDENNRLNHLNNIAIVFNGIRPRGFGSKNYGYGYGYGYIYDNDRMRIANT